MFINLNKDFFPLDKAVYLVIATSVDQIILIRIKVLHSKIQLQYFKCVNETS